MNIRSPQQIELQNKIQELTEEIKSAQSALNSLNESIKASEKKKQTLLQTQATLKEHKEREAKREASLLNELTQHKTTSETLAQEKEQILKKITDFIAAIEAKKALLLEASSSDLLMLSDDADADDASEEQLANQLTDIESRLTLTANNIVNLESRSNKASQQEDIEDISFQENERALGSVSIELGLLMTDKSEQEALLTTLNTKMNSVVEEQRKLMINQLNNRFSRLKSLLPPTVVQSLNLPKTPDILPVASDPIPPSVPASTTIAVTALQQPAVAPNTITDNVTPVTSNPAPSTPSVQATDGTPMDLTSHNTPPVVTVTPAAATVPNETKGSEVKTDGNDHPMPEKTNTTPKTKTKKRKLINDDSDDDLIEINEESLSICSIEGDEEKRSSGKKSHHHKSHKDKEDKAKKKKPKKQYFEYDEHDDSDLDERNIGHSSFTKVLKKIIDQLDIYIAECKLSTTESPVSKRNKMNDELNKIVNLSLHNFLGTASRQNPLIACRIAIALIRNPMRSPGFDKTVEEADRLLDLLPVDNEARKRLVIAREGVASTLSPKVSDTRTIIAKESSTINTPTSSTTREITMMFEEKRVSKVPAPAKAKDSSSPLPPAKPLTLKIPSTSGTPISSPKVVPKLTTMRLPPPAASSSTKVSTLAPASSPSPTPPANKVTIFSNAIIVDTLAIDFETKICNNDDINRSIDNIIDNIRTHNTLDKTQLESLKQKMSLHYAEKTTMMNTLYSTFIQYLLTLATHNKNHAKFNSTTFNEMCALLLNDPLFYHKKDTQKGKIYVLWENKTTGKNSFRIALESLREPELIDKLITTASNHFRDETASYLLSKSGNLLHDYIASKSEGALQKFLELTQKLAGDKKTKAFSQLVDKRDANRSTTTPLGYCLNQLKKMKPDSAEYAVEHAVLIRMANTLLMQGADINVLFMSNVGNLSIFDVMPKSLIQQLTLPSAPSVTKPTV